MDSNKLTASGNGPQQTSAILDSKAEGVEEDMADPGIIIKFSPKENIHRLLSLGAVSHIQNLDQGINEDDSWRIFLGWLNGIVSKHAGPAAAVRTLDDTPVPGLFHNLQPHQLSLIEAELSKLVGLSAQIMANGVQTHSAGLFFAIVCSGISKCNIVHKNLGPFLCY